MGIQLKKDPSKKGRFIKLFPAVTPGATKVASTPEPALFWDKYSCSAFAPIGQLQTYNPSFESLERYSLTNIKNTLGHDYYVGVVAHRAFPDTNFGLVQEDIVFYHQSGQCGGSINWNVNAKILGLVSTSHKIEWKATYFIKEPDDMLEVEVSDWGEPFTPTGKFAGMYDTFRGLYPNGIDLLSDPQVGQEIEYIDPEDGRTRQYFIRLAHLGVHTVYNRAWITIPKLLTSAHDNAGLPTIFSGTLRLSATVDGISAGEITFDVLRLISSGGGT